MGNNSSSSRSRSNSSPGLLRKIREKAMNAKAIGGKGTDQTNNNHAQNRSFTLTQSSASSGYSNQTSSSGSAAAGTTNGTTFISNSDLNITSIKTKNSLDIDHESSASSSSGHRRNKSSGQVTELDQSVSPSEFKKFFAENYLDQPRYVNNANHQKRQPTTTTITTTTTKTNTVSRINAEVASKQLTRSMMSLKPKTNPIYEDYVISKTVLGLGISGKVLGCVNKQTKQKYALKTLRESIKAKREIDLHWRACQSCPYIVQIVDVYENTINTQKVILVVMECMEGGELFAKISERTKPFTEQEVAKIMYQICTAVKHLHSMNIAHRDLKPENLLLTANDETAVIKLTDFGFAKEVNLGLVTPCYTPYYVAPEVLGSERYDISCDIWSLGVIMYILCCGYPPFYSTHGQPISPGMKKRIKAGEYTFPDAEWSRVSQDAKSLISGMLETVPEKRSTIVDIMRSSWISSYFNVPATPLPSLDILKEDREQWKEIQQNMGMALDEMRINWDSKVMIKKLDIVNNPLFERRMKKTKAGDEGPGATASRSGAMPPPAVAFSEPMIVEEYSREHSMITPTNSRQSSPNRK